MSEFLDRLYQEEMPLDVPNMDEDSLCNNGCFLERIEYILETAEDFLVQ